MPTATSHDEAVTYGFLGVGAIAEAMVVGLCAEHEHAPEVVLSPRGRTRSAVLAERHATVRVAPDNQAVVDAADVVVVAVRPSQASVVLEPIAWPRTVAVVSVMAGVSVPELTGLLEPVTDVARAIPLPSVAHRAAPVPVLPPTDAACALFDRLGGALPVLDDALFDAFSAVTGTLAAQLRLWETTSRWLAARGADEAAAARYVASTYCDLAGAFAAAPDVAALSAEYATPGGLNDRFATDLEEAGAFRTVERALSGIHDGLRDAAPG